MSDDPFELALLDVLGRERHTRLTARAVLEQRVAFFEFSRPGEKQVPEATPSPSIVRPAANTDVDSSSPASKRPSTPLQRQTRVVRGRR